MSRSRKNVVPFKRYESLAPNGNEKGYIRLTKSLWKSDAFRDIGKTSRLVYIDMRFAAGGTDEVSYTQEMARKDLSISKETYKKAISELEKVGLVKKKPRSHYAPNTFVFSAEWQKYESRDRDSMTGEIVKEKGCFPKWKKTESSPIN